MNKYNRQTYKLTTIYKYIHVHIHKNRNTNKHTHTHNSLPPIGNTAAHQRTQSTFTQQKNKVGIPYPLLTAANEADSAYVCNSKRGYSIIVLQSVKLPSTCPYKIEHKITRRTVVTVFIAHFSRVIHSAEIDRLTAL